MLHANDLKRILSISEISYVFSSLHMTQVHIRKSRRCLMCHRQMFSGDAMLCGSFVVKHDFTPSKLAYININVCSEECYQNFAKALLHKSIRQLRIECNIERVVHRDRKQKSLETYSDICQMTMDGCT